MGEPRTPVEILLVEDDPTDAELFIRAPKKHNLANRLVWVKFRNLVEQEVAGITIIRSDGLIEYVNPYFAALMGRSAAEVTGKNLLDYLPQNEHARVLDSWRQHFSGQKPFEQIASSVQAKDGGTVDVLVNAALAMFQGRPASIAVVLDVTERNKAERALRRLNRALRTLSSGNEILVRAGSEPELLREMCRIVVENGGYRMAWIGEARHDAARTIAPVAWAGAEAGYLSDTRFSWADEPAGRGPAGFAIRSGEPQTSQNLAADPSMAPWQREALKRGFASTAALPLANVSGAFGVLTIYAGEPDAFDTEELTLLCKLADDLAYGVRALRDRSERERAERRWHDSLEATIAAIASTVEMRDPYTAGHQQRVAALAVAIARDLQLSEHQIRGLYLASVIHDVGKIHIPAEILTKPGKLSSLEFQMIQGHAEAGYEIVKGVEFPWPIAEMVRQHHERLDGSGYPRGLQGDAMLEEAKILAVADVVEAMTSRRPYREPLGIDAALAEIAQGKAIKYDPAAVDVCVALFRQNRFAFR
jgi:PAS domain S-box-containing protein